MHSAARYSLSDAEVMAENWGSPKSLHPLKLAAPMMAAEACRSLRLRDKTRLICCTKHCFGLSVQCGVRIWGSVSVQLPGSLLPPVAINKAGLNYEKKLFPAGSNTFCINSLHLGLVIMRLSSWSLLFSTACATIDVKVLKDGGKEASPLQYGLMFEDINHSGDGGM